MVCVWIWKIKMSNFQFFSLWVKKISSVRSKSTRVKGGLASYLLRVKSKLGSDQGPSLLQSDFERDIPIWVIQTVYWPRFWSDNFFCCLTSGRIGSVTSGCCKLSPQTAKFFNFSTFVSKKSHWVESKKYHGQSPDGLLFNVGQMYARVGSGPVASMFKLDWTAFILVKKCF